MRNSPSQKLFLAVVLICLAVPSLAADLTASLADVERQYKNGADMKQVEQACLGLLDSYPAPSDTGKIYAEIPILYMTAYGGTKQSQTAALSAASVISYCQTALTYPLDSATATKVYLVWGLTEEKSAPYGLSSDTDFSAASARATAAYLKGLKYLADQGVPDVKPDVSSIGETPRDPAARNEWAKQLEAVYKTRNLVDTRAFYVAQIRCLYRHMAYDAEGLRAQAEKVIGKSSTVDKLIASLDNNQQ